jgi:hypothetical protein
VLIRDTLSKVARVRVLADGFRAFFYIDSDSAGASANQRARCGRNHTQLPTSVLWICNIHMFSLTMLSSHFAVELDHSLILLGYFPHLVESE